MEKGGVAVVEIIGLPNMGEMISKLLVGSENNKMEEERHGFQ